MSEPKATAHMAHILVETRINTDPVKVWRALTNDIGLWWPQEFYTGGTEGRRRIFLEATPGGRMYETWDDGGGLLWATVWTVQPTRLLQLSGLAFPQWGGPSLWLGSFELEGKDDHTNVRFTEHTLGTVEEAQLESKRKGWSFLFGSSLKAFLEGTKPPTWAD